MVNEMKVEKIYESPKAEIVEISTEQVIFVVSLYGEGIEEWEDM